MSSMIQTACPLPGAGLSHMCAVLKVVTRTSLIGLHNIQSSQRIFLPCRNHEGGLRISAPAAGIHHPAQPKMSGRLLASYRF